MQSHHPAWKAFPASDECRAAAAGARGPSGSQPRAPSYLQALQRKTNDSLGVADVVFILNGVDSPCLSREATTTGRGSPCRGGGAGGPGRRVVSVDACDSPSAVLLLTSHFPKRKEINIQIHLLSKWSFAAKKKKVTLALEALEVKPPGDM